MRKYILVMLSALLLGLNACISDNDEDEDDDGNWIGQGITDFFGNTRSGAVSFVIGDFAYVGLGFGDLSTTERDYLSDFWRYDPSRNVWTEIAPFPGVARTEAVAFSIDGKGYVGTGLNDDLAQTELGDFWMYDPLEDTWTEIASFPGSPRYSAVAFSLNGLGYVGTGFDGNYTQDFYRYDPQSGVWSESLPLFGSRRENAVAFVVDGKAFVGTGLNNDRFLYDLYAFNPEADTWENFTIVDDEDDFFDEFRDAMERYDAVAFVVEDIVYFTTGRDGSSLNDVISFDPFTGVWEDDYTNFEGVARGGAVAFVINGQGYVGTGSNGTTSSASRYSDVWAWRPNEEYEEFD